jgi:hypothetical protein
MSSSSSSAVMEDQIVTALSGAMEEAVSILTAEEVGYSSTPQPKRRWRYINREREAAHLSMYHDYFNNDCVYHSSYFH